MSKEILSTILNLYKDDKITKEDTVKLIEDLYYNNNILWDIS